MNPILNVSQHEPTSSDYGIVSDYSQRLSPSSSAPDAVRSSAGCGDNPSSTTPRTNMKHHTLTHAPPCPEHAPLLASSWMIENYQFLGKMHVGMELEPGPCLCVYSIDRSVLVFSFVAPPSTYKRVSSRPRRCLLSSTLPLYARLSPPFASISFPKPFYSILLNTKTKTQTQGKKKQKQFRYVCRLVTNKRQLPSLETTTLPSAKLSTNLNPRRETRKEKQQDDTSKGSKKTERSHAGYSMRDDGVQGRTSDSPCLCA